MSIREGNGQLMIFCAALTTLWSLALSALVQADVSLTTGRNQPLINTRINDQTTDDVWESTPAKFLFSHSVLFRLIKQEVKLYSGEINNLINSSPGPHGNIKVLKINDICWTSCFRWWAGRPAEGDVSLHPAADTAVRSPQLGEGLKHTCAEPTPAPHAALTRRCHTCLVWWMYGGSNMLKLSGQVYLYRTFKNNEFDQSGQSPAAISPIPSTLKLSLCSVGSEMLTSLFKQLGVLVHVNFT